MSAPELLNLDELASDEVKKIRLDGTEHTAVEMTVEAYIARTRRAKKIDPDAGIDEQIEETVRLLHEVFPSLSEDRLRKLTLRQLGKFLDFALAAPKDIAEQAIEQAKRQDGNSPQAAAGND